MPKVHRPRAVAGSALLPGIEQSHTIVLGSRTKSDVLNLAHLAKVGGISWLAQSQACLVMSAMEEASNRGRG